MRVLELPRHLNLIIKKLRGNVASNQILIKNKLAQVYARRKGDSRERRQYVRRIVDPSVKKKRKKEKRRRRKKKREHVRKIHGRDVLTAIRSRRYFLKVTYCLSAFAFDQAKRSRDTFGSDAYRSFPLSLALPPHPLFLFHVQCD